MSSMHRCEYCKCWVQPDPLSIRNHESGKRHAEAVKAFMTAQRVKKLQEQKEQAALATTLQEIEAAARAAMGLPVAEAPSAASAAVPAPAAAARLQPARPAAAAAAASPAPAPAPASAPAPAEAPATEETAAASIPPPLPLGANSVTLEDGATVLAPGDSCQVHWAEHDVWYDARVIDGMEVEIPPAEGTTDARKAPGARVQFTLFGTIADVPAAALRVFTAASTTEAPPEPVLDETTGLGAWTSIAAGTIDADAARAGEKRSREVAEEEEAAAAKKGGKGRSVMSSSGAASSLADADYEGDNALAAYNPLGRGGGMYKGINLDGEEGGSEQGAGASTTAAAAAAASAISISLAPPAKRSRFTTAASGAEAPAAAPPAVTAFGSQPAPAPAPAQPVDAPAAAAAGAAVFKKRVLRPGAALRTRLAEDDE